MPEQLDQPTEEPTPLVPEVPANKPTNKPDVAGTPDFEATSFELGIARITEDTERLNHAMDDIDIALMLNHDTTSVIDLVEWGEWADWGDVIWDALGPRTTEYEYDDGEDRNQGSDDIDQLIDPTYDPANPDDDSDDDSDDDWLAEEE